MQRAQIDELITRLHLIEGINDPSLYYELQRGSDTAIKMQIEEIDAVSKDIELIALEIKKTTQKTDLDTSKRLAAKYLSKFPKY